jgi:hypothetical protein
MAEGSCGGSTDMVGSRHMGGVQNALWGLKRVMGVETRHCGWKYLGEDGDMWVRVEIRG